MYFTIDNENTITAYDAMPPAQNGIAVFRTEEHLSKATADWPISRMVETWNSFAGVTPFGDLRPVKKFENRKIAVARIWTAIQKLAPVVVEQPKPKAAKPDAPATPQSEESTDAKPAREGTAKAKVIELIRRPDGATLEEIMAATGWQKHTVRGFISTLPKKTGLAITSTRRESDKARVYAAQ